MVKVYVDWLNEKVISEEEFGNMVSAKAAENVDDDSLLAEFLADEHGIVEVFNMDEATKANVRGEFSSWCYDKAEAELREDWTEHTV